MRLRSKQARDFRWQTVIRLYQAGKKQQQIAELSLISQSSVSRIIKRYEQTPAQLIATKAGIGSKKRLSEQALEQVKSWASKNAVEFGFQGQYWTRGRFKRLIKEKFGVEYQLSGVGNLLKSLRVTLQKPMLRDYRQKPEQLVEWKAEKLPAIKKSRASAK
jgi:transposase